MTLLPEAEKAKDEPESKIVIPGLTKEEPKSKKVLIQDLASDKYTPNHEVKFLL